MEIRESDFEEMVLNSDRPVLVDFWASWCPPCKMMQPVVERLALNVGDWADIYSINIDRSPALASQFQVSGVPTFISFAGGQPIDRRTGALTEGQMLNLLNAAGEAMPPETLEDQFDTGTQDSFVHDECCDESFDEALQDRSSGQDEARSRRTHPARPYITIVSGLPRSGTSMMMRMLDVGGIPAMTDELRSPDEDNPNGYYEFEDVRDIENYAAWIDQAPGHSVKMVYSLLKHLPNDREYRVVFMRRNVDEILQSQKTMLERSGIETDIPDATMKVLFEQELRHFYEWLPSQTHLKLVNVSYNDLFTSAETAVAQINSHFDESLDVSAMIAILDPGLYRHRAA